MVRAIQVDPSLDVKGSIIRRLRARENAIKASVNKIHGRRVYEYVKKKLKLEY
jgi:hypothetical protein